MESDRRIYKGCFFCLNPDSSRQFFGYCLCGCGQAGDFRICIKLFQLDTFIGATKGGYAGEFPSRCFLAQPQAVVRLVSRQIRSAARQ